MFRRSISMAPSRLFTEESKGRALELVSAATYSAGVQTLVYQRRR